MQNLQQDWTSAHLKPFQECAHTMQVVIADGGINTQLCQNALASHNHEAHQHCSHHHLRKGACTLSNCCGCNIAITNVRECGIAPIHRTKVVVSQLGDVLAKRGSDKWQARFTDNPTKLVGSQPCPTSGLELAVHTNDYSTKTSILEYTLVFIRFLIFHHYPCKS